MESKVSYVLVGAFVLLLSAVLIAGVLWLTAGAPRETFETYAVYPSESVSGLSVGSTVYYKGVPVGRVTTVGLDPEDPQRVRLLLAIKPNTPVKTDTVAVLEVQGLTGVADINLTGGSRAAPRLVARANQPYPVINSVPSLWGRLDQVVSELSANIKEVGGRVNDLLDANNRRLIGETLADLHKLTSVLAARSPELTAALSDLAATLHEARQVGTKLPAAIDQVQRSAAGIERMADEATKTAAALRKVTLTSGAVVQRIENDTLPQATALMTELQRAAEELKNTLAELRRDPNALIYGAPRRPPGPGEAHR